MAYGRFSTMPLTAPDAARSAAPAPQVQTQTHTAATGGAGAALLERDAGWSVMENYQLLFARGQSDLVKRFVDYVAGKLRADPKTMYVHSSEGLWKLTGQSAMTESQRKRMIVDEAIAQGLEELPASLGKPSVLSGGPPRRPTQEEASDEGPEAARFIANVETLAGHLIDSPQRRGRETTANPDGKTMTLSRQVQDRDQVRDPWAFMQAFCTAKLITGMRDSWSRYLVTWGIDRYAFWSRNALLKDEDGWEIWAGLAYLCMKDDEFTSSGKVYSRLTHDSYMMEKATLLHRSRDRMQTLLQRHASW